MSEIVRHRMHDAFMTSPFKALSFFITGTAVCIKALLNTVAGDISTHTNQTFLHILFGVQNPLLEKL